MPLITLTCSICQKQYKMSSWYKDRLFCTNKCRGVWLKNKGTVPPPRTGSTPWNKGLSRFTDERINSMAEGRRGGKNWQWKHGNSRTHRTMWQTSIHKQWRMAVFSRDDYTCQWCGVRGGRLEADHIKCFAHHSNLRYEVSNGRTLCKSCHILTPTYGNHKTGACS